MWREDLVCRSIALKGLPELVNTLGGDAESLMRASGLDPKAIKSNARYISWIAFQNFLSRAAKELHVPDLALRWAFEQKPDFSNLGPITVMVITAPDMRTCIDMWIMYARIHTNACYTDIHEDVERGVFRAIARQIPAASDLRHDREYFIASMYRIAQNYAPPEFQPKRIGFSHQPMADISVYESYFDCPVEFSSAQTYIEFPHGLLDHKLGQGFSVARKAFEAYMRRQLEKSPTQTMSVSSHVALALPSILGVGASQADDVAQALGMSQKKMQRLLSDEGSRYSVILDEVRYSLARQLLGDSDIAISRIAGLLDYSSSIAFRNACKRWTNMSPRQYRKFMCQQEDWHTSMPISLAQETLYPA